jgi:hypothetical protein
VHAFGEPFEGIRAGGDNGFRFAECGFDDSYRDVLCRRDCDDGARELCRLLGWDLPPPAAAAAAAATAAECGGGSGAALSPTGDIPAGPPPVVSSAKRAANGGVVVARAARAAPTGGGVMPSGELPEVPSAEASGGRSAHAPPTETAPPAG